MARQIKVLDVLLIPREDRNKGRGTEIMTKLCAWADVENTTIVVSADSTVCGRKGSDLENTRLVDFYSRFGFTHSSIRRLYTDTVWTSVNIMERHPEGFGCGQIVKITELIQR